MPSVCRRGRPAGWGGRVSAAPACIFSLRAVYLYPAAISAVAGRRGPRTQSVACRAVSGGGNDRPPPGEPAPRRSPREVWQPAHCRGVSSCQDRRRTGGPPRRVAAANCHDSYRRTVTERGGWQTAGHRGGSAPHDSSVRHSRAVAGHLGRLIGQLHKERPSPR